MEVGFATLAVNAQKTLIFVFVFCILFHSLGQWWKNILVMA
jgi:hypothetical protein